ncbi:MAG: hypothetical protein ACTSXD_01360 [Candidatus Heimdallarchaeaceae archaeon]
MSEESDQQFFELVKEIDEIVFRPMREKITSIEYKQVLIKEKDDVKPVSTLLDEEKDEITEISSIMDKIGINSKEANILEEEQLLLDEAEESTKFLQLKDNYPEYNIYIKQIYCSSSYQEDKVITLLQRNLNSLKDIKIKKSENKLFPFLLHNIKYVVEEPYFINFHEYKIPIYRTLQEEKLRFYPVGEYPFNEKDKIFENKWVPLISSLQHALIKSINEGKLAEKKVETIDKIEISHVDFNKLKESIDASVDNLKKVISNLSKENVLYNFERFWRNEKQFNHALSKLKKQLKDIEQELKEEDDKIKKEYLELKTKQVQLNKETKMYKQLENQGIKIEREKKEKVAKLLSEFQRKKELVQQKLSEFKKKKHVLEQLIELIDNNENIEEFEKNFRELFKKDIDNALESIKKAMAEKESNAINFEKNEEIDKSIRLHVVWVPIYLIYFKAFQEGKKIDGKAFYSDFENKVFIITPATS